MGSSDALPVPRKNAAYRAYFKIDKNDGSLITSWTSAAASISKDGGTPAAPGDAPHEIGTTFGGGYIDLTATEMNADQVTLKVTVTNSGALPTMLYLYPEETGDIRVNVTAGAQVIWDALTSALTTSGSIGKLLVDNINATISSRSTLTAQAVWDALTSALTTSGSIGKLLVDNVNATISSRLAGASYTSPPSAADNADAVWDEALSGHLTAGSTGAQLNSAGASGDPWATDLTSGYSGTQAGNLLVQDYLKSLLISAENVSFSTPNDPITGDLTLVRGDDYTVSSGRTLPEWSSADWTPFDLSSAASVTFKARTRYSETIFEKAAVVISDTQVRVELTAAETAAFAVGRDAYRFDLEAVLATDDVVTLAQGMISVLEDVRIAE